MKCLFHIPHASTIIPPEYLKYFYLNSEDLNSEIHKMTDHFIDDLFDSSVSCFDTLMFPVSRLLVDPERFERDEFEVMAKIGMGCIYERTHDGQMLKEAYKIRDELIEKYYRPHHRSFTNAVQKLRASDSEILIIDCHSFPKEPLPYEIDQDPDRAQICIGTDDFHTPPKLTEYFASAFLTNGFSVSINKPFSGSIVPIKFYKQDAKVNSIMIEVRRDLYMNEATGKKIDYFLELKNTFSKILDIPNDII